ncbi:MAG TPA: hypothetical protein DCZ95_12530 [Verrucomicrobia bacterium]|nr:hypothetical protein [Verrucomicrobiota bacterium]
MKKRIALIVITALFLAMPAMAAQVTLAWDANSPAPTGYRIFTRQAGQQYDYTKPAWQGAATTCTVTVPDGAESFYVARAYVSGTATGKTEESGDSNEVVALTKPIAPKNLLLQAIDEIIQGLNTLKDAVGKM